MKPYFILILVSFGCLEAQETKPSSSPQLVKADIPPAADAPIKVKSKPKERIRSVPVVYYTILSKSSGNSAAVIMGEKKDGGMAIESNSQLSHEQQWQLKPVEGHWFQLINRYSDKALTIRDPSRVSVIQGNAAGSENSHWELISDSDGFVRFENRTNNQCMGVSKLNGSQGDGLILSEKADTDRQKWKIEVAEVDYVSELLSKKLAIPASTLIDKKHPATTAELKEFLHGTTWSIRYESTEGSEEYRMTFDKKGTLKLNTGRVSTLHFIGPKAIKLWNYDYAALSVQFNYFQAVDCNGKVYYGVLLPNEQ